MHKVLWHPTSNRTEAERYALKWMSSEFNMATLLSSYSMNSNIDTYPNDVESFLTHSSDLYGCFQFKLW